jgi:hypothetical protein
MQDIWEVPARTNVRTAYRQTEHSVFYKYIRGSAYAASALEFAIFFALTAIWFIIFEFAIEPAYPGIFPVSNLYSIALFAVITFTAPLFWAAQQQLYQDFLRLFSRTMGGTVTMASKICAFLDSTNLNDMVSNYFAYSDGKLDRKTVTLKEVLRDLNNILRAAAFAQRFEHRTPSNAPARSSLDRASNVSDLVVEELPMPQHLKDELLVYQFSESTGGLADQLWNMLYARLSVLAFQPSENSSRSYVPLTLFDSLDAQLGALSTDTAEIIAIKWTRVLSIIIYFLRVTIYLFCFSISWQLWGEYGWLGLLAAVPIEWTVLALYRVGAKISDPFGSWNSSPYVWIDLTQVAVNTAQSIDEVFDRKFEYLSGKRAERQRPLGISYRLFKTNYV